jgi:hypothetical protein
MTRSQNPKNGEIKNGEIKNSEMKNGEIKKKSEIMLIGSVIKEDRRRVRTMILTKRESVKY